MSHSHSHRVRLLVVLVPPLFGTIYCVALETTSRGVSLGVSFNYQTDGIVLLLYSVFILLIQLFQKKKKWKCMLSTVRIVLVCFLVLQS